MNGFKLLTDIVPENARRITLEAKLDNCRAMLLVNGLVTEKESRQISARLEQRVRAESRKDFHFGENREHT